MLPVFAGISGSCSTIFSLAISYLFSISVPGKSGQFILRIVRMHGQPAAVQKPVIPLNSLADHCRRDLLMKTFLYNFRPICTPQKDSTI